MQRDLQVWKWFIDYETLELSCIRATVSTYEKFELSIAGYNNTIVDQCLLEINVDLLDKSSKLRNLSHTEKNIYLHDIPAGILDVDKKTALYKFVILFLKIWEYPNQNEEILRIAYKLRRIKRIFDKRYPHLLLKTHDTKILNRNYHCFWI